MLSDPQLHYLDNAATTRIDPAVTEVIHDALVELWANPSSLYDPAVAAQDGIDTARARIARTLHCRKDEIYFTGCGTEGNNMAIWGAAMPRRAWGRKVVVTGFEHPSVQLAARALQREGFEIVEIRPEADGRIDTEKFLAAVDNINKQLDGMDLPALTAGITGLSEEMRVQLEQLPSLRRDAQAALQDISALARHADIELSATFRRADKALADISSLSSAARKAMDSADQLLREDSAPMIELSQTMRALREAAASVSNLATLLELQPDALIFGRSR